METEHRPEKPGYFDCFVEAMRELYGPLCGTLQSDMKSLYIFTGKNGEETGKLLGMEVRANEAKLSQNGRKLQWEHH